MLAKRGYFAFNSSLTSPLLYAAKTIAVSVGSPICVSLPFSITTVPSEHNVAYVKSFLTLSVLELDISSRSS